MTAGRGTTQMVSITHSKILDHSPAPSINNQSNKSDNGEAVK